jgi:excisionase family DNA binding protein
MAERYALPALPLSEVARRLSISRSSAHRLVASGELPAIRIGLSWRVLRSDFDSYVERLRAEAEQHYRGIRD